MSERRHNVAITSCLNLFQILISIWWLTKSQIISNFIPVKSHYFSPHKFILIAIFWLAFILISIHFSGNGGRWTWVWSFRNDENIYQQTYRWKANVRSMGCRGPLETSYSSLSGKEKGWWKRYIPLTLVNLFTHSIFP